MKINKDTEYSSIRQEILDLITSRDNYIIAMYTITAAILCVAFELQNSILFLIPYIIIFAFQNAISSKNENMIVLASYIAVYLEEGEGWESNNYEIKKFMHKGITYKRANSIWKFLVGRIGSVQLGILCSISCVVYSVISFFKTTEMYDYISSSVCILLSIVCYILIRVQVKDVLNLGKRKDAYIKNIKTMREEKEKEGLTME